VPSFDIVSEVDHGELVNALTQARKELATRFDFKNSPAEIDEASPTVIKLAAADGSKLAGLLEIVIGKLAKRNIDLRNIDRKDPAISSKVTKPRKLSKPSRRTPSRSNAPSRTARFVSQERKKTTSRP